MNALSPPRASEATPYFDVGPKVTTPSNAPVPPVWDEVQCSETLAIALARAREALRLMLVSSR
jgi:hypothetical protein